MRANILILGLDDSLAAELRRALGSDPHSVTSTPLTSAAAAAENIARFAADVVFCDAEPASVNTVLAALRAHHRNTPVVAASRLPEVSRWLDALEAGAWDYCASPFEPCLVRQIVDGALIAGRLQIAS